MAKQAEWIGEEKASELLGLKPKTIKVYIERGELPVRRSKATPRSKSVFHLGDINTHLNNKQIARNGLLVKVTYKLCKP